MYAMWILATLLVYYSRNCVGTSEPILYCPTYLSEGNDLDCECRSTSPDNSCKTYWLEHLAGSRLHKVNVTPDDNGTHFTCETDCNGQKSSTDYTLQVAYGPSEGIVSVQGPSSFLADGHQTMKLTCVPGDMNPAPTFKWTNNVGLQCIHGDKENTCVIRPQNLHDGKSVSCRVTNEETAAYVTEDFTLNVKYPPPTAPLLTGYTEQTPLKPGDTLNCTVKGGNPLVSNVSLKCSDHEFPCKHLMTGDSCLTSCRVSFKEVAEEIQCSCSAVWEPDPKLYALVAKDSIKVEKPHLAGREHGSQGQQESSSYGDGTGSARPIISGLTAVLIVIAIAVIIVFVIRIRNRRRNVCHNSKEVNILLPDAVDPIRKSDIEKPHLSACGSTVGASSSSDKSILEGEVEEHVRTSGDYLTVLDSITIGVKTPVTVLYVREDTSCGYTEVQLDTPSAEPELPVPTVSPYGDVDISQLDLSKPEVCHPVNHSASFQNIQSTPRYRGPLGNYFTLVDKKKGCCLHMVHEDANEKLADIVETDHKCSTETGNMKSHQVEDCDGGTYEKLHYGSKPTLRVEKPEQVYSHIDRAVSPSHDYGININVC